MMIGMMNLMKMQKMTLNLLVVMMTWPRKHNQIMAKIMEIKGKVPYHKLFFNLNKNYLIHLKEEF